MTSQHDSEAEIRTLIEARSAEKTSGGLIADTAVGGRMK